LSNAEVALFAVYSSYAGNINGLLHRYILK